MKRVLTTGMFPIGIPMAMPQPTSFAVSRDGSLAAFGSHDLRIYDLGTGDCKFKKSHGAASMIQALSFSPKDEYLAYAYEGDRKVYILDLRTGNELFLSVDLDSILALAFSSSNDLAVGGRPNRVVIHTMSTEYLKYYLDKVTGNAHQLFNTGETVSVGFSPTSITFAKQAASDAFVVGSELGDLAAYQSGRQWAMVLNTHRGKVHSLTSTSGGSLLSLGEDRRLRLWDIGDMSKLGFGVFGELPLEIQTQPTGQTMLGTSLLGSPFQANYKAGRIIMNRLPFEAPSLGDIAEKAPSKPLGEMSTDEWMQVLAQQRKWSLTYPLTASADHYQDLSEKVKRQLLSFEKQGLEQIRADEFISLIRDLSLYQLFSTPEDPERLDLERQVQAWSHRIYPKLFALVHKDFDLRDRPYRSLSLDERDRLIVLAKTFEEGREPFSDFDISLAPILGTERISTSGPKRWMQNPNFSAFEFLSVLLLDKEHSARDHFLGPQAQERSFSDLADREIMGLAEFVADLLNRPSETEKARLTVEAVVREFFWNELDINSKAKQRRDLVHRIEAWTNRRKKFETQNGEHSFQFAERILNPDPKLWLRFTDNEITSMLYPFGKKGALVKESLFWKRLREQGFDFGAFRFPRSTEHDGLKNWDFDLARFSLLRRFEHLSATDTKMGFVSKAEIKARQTQLKTLLQQATTLTPIADPSEAQSFLQRLEPLKSLRSSKDLATLMAAIQDVVQMMSPYQRSAANPLQEPQIQQLLESTNDLFSRHVLQSFHRALDWPKTFKNWGISAEQRGVRLIVEFQSLGFSKTPWKLGYLKKRGQFDVRVILQTEEPGGARTKISSMDIAVPTLLERGMDVVESSEFKAALGAAVTQGEKEFMTALIKLRPTEGDQKLIEQVAKAEHALAMLKSPQFTERSILDAAYPTGMNDESVAALDEIKSQESVRRALETIGFYAIQKRGHTLVVEVKNLGFQQAPGVITAGTLDLEFLVYLRSQEGELKQIGQTGFQVHARSNEIRELLAEPGVQEELQKYLPLFLTSLLDKIASPTDEDLPDLTQRLSALVEARRSCGSALGKLAHRANQGESR